WGWRPCRSRSQHARSSYTPWIGRCSRVVGSRFRAPRFRNSIAPARAADPSLRRRPPPPPPRRIGLALALAAAQRPAMLAPARAIAARLTRPPARLTRKLMRRALVPAARLQFAAGDGSGRQRPLEPDIRAARPAVDPRPLVAAAPELDDAQRIDVERPAADLADFHYRA